MKIHASGFNIDMNAMLNQLNGHNIHGYYNKIIAKNAADNNKIINDMNTKIKKGDSRSIDRYNAIGEIIKNDRATNENMWNHAIPDKIRKAMDDTLNQVPTSTVYYYPPGQYPSDPSPGDIVWHIPDPSEFGSNGVKASAERYYKNGGWQPIKGANQDVFGANILGANIKGGEITGAEFRSNEQNSRDRAAFSVNAEGRLYAQNLQADLEHYVSGGQVNPINYHGYVDSHEGFSLSNGILGMTAYAQQHGGLPIWSDNPAFVGHTLLEPGYLKLRYNRDDDNENYVRSDLRAGILEIAGNTWNDNKGIRMGYWSPHHYPHLAIGDWDFHETANGSDDLYIQNNTGSEGIIQLNGPVNVSGTLTAGNGKRIATGDDLTRVHNALNDHQTEIDSANTTISNHGTIIDNQGQTINTQGGTLNWHGSRLDGDDTTLSNHDGRITDNASDINNLKSEINTFGNLSNQLSGIQYVLRGMLPAFGTGLQLSFSGHTISSDAGWVSIGGSGNWQELAAGSFSKHSDLSTKKDITSINSSKALAQILGTDVKSWRYRFQDNNAPKNMGPIIDDIHDHKDQKYYIPHNFTKSDENGNRFVLDNAISYLILSIQELEKQNSQQTQRIAKLEFENQRK